MLSFSIFPDLSKGWSRWTLVFWDRLNFYLSSLHQDCVYKFSGIQAPDVSSRDLKWAFLRMSVGAQYGWGQGIQTYIRKVKYVEFGLQLYFLNTVKLLVTKQILWCKKHELFHFSGVIYSYIVIYSFCFCVNSFFAEIQNNLQIPGTLRNLIFRSMCECSTWSSNHYQQSCPWFILFNPQLQILTFGDRPPKLESRFSTSNVLKFTYFLF